MVIQLISLNHRVSIPIDNLSAEEENKLWDDLARHSDVVNGWTNGCIRLVNSQKTRVNFHKIFQDYSNKSVKVIQLWKFLENRKVEDGAFFYVFNPEHSRIYERFAALEVLKCDNRNYLNWVMRHNRVFGLWSNMSFEFDVFAFGNDGLKFYNGEPDKRKRICRFCGEAHKSYKSAAHAIPHAIGNHLLFCLEECDECNNELNKLERQFTNLMDFRRAMFKLEGKDNNGLIEIQGANYTIKPDADGIPIIYIKEDAAPKKCFGDEYKVFKFNHYEPVTDQDIYRALVKFVIDLMPDDRLKYFGKTIDWIVKKNVNDNFEALPSILYGELPEGNIYSQPELLVFFRRNQVERIPYCTAMLFTTDVVYQFVIPFASNDGQNFIYDEDLAESRIRINKYFNIKWERQEFFSWWESYIWNYRTVNVNSPYVKFLPEDDPIFKKEKILTDENDRLFASKIFNSDDISEMRFTQIEADNFTRYASRHGDIDFNFNEAGISFFLNIPDNSGRIVLHLPVNQMSYILDLNISLEYKIRNLDRILTETKFVTGSSFQSLMIEVVRKSIIEINIFLRRKAKESNFRPYTLRLPVNLIMEADLDILTPNGSIIKTKSKTIADWD